MKHRIVAVTPAGRRRYMRLLVPYLLSSDLVDRYDIWLNTEDPNDLAFLKALSGHEKVRLVHQPNGVVQGNQSINAFFKFAQDPEEVYLRFDDDIVWMERDAIRNLVEFRLSKPEYFLITPYIVNNAMCSALLQLHGRLRAFPKVHPFCADHQGWASAEFAEKLHRAFLAALDEGRHAEFRANDAQFAACRFSINCVSWFGSDLQPYHQIFEGDEEEQLSFAIPALANRCNSVVGNALVAHFAFYTQREHLDRLDILERYLAVRDRTDWLKPEVIAFVEKAYRATAAPAEAAAGLPAQKRLADKPFHIPVAIRIKKRRTTLAEIGQRMFGSR